MGKIDKKLIKNNMTPFLKHLIEIILPHRCPLCGVVVNDATNLCHRCFGEIDFISPPFCDVCGIPFARDELTGSVCGACLEHLPAFDKARSVFAYEGKGRDLVLGFKYADRTETTEAFAKWLLRAGKDFFDGEEKTTLIMPVPMHRHKLMLRRYNQAALLANYVGQIAQIRVDCHNLERVRKTKPQSEYNAKGRKDNVRGAFALKKAHLLKGERVLLIDDVLTTGATVAECAKVLKKAGAEKVEVLVLARALKG